MSEFEGTLHRKTRLEMNYELKGSQGNETKKGSQRGN